MNLGYNKETKDKNHKYSINSKTKPEHTNKNKELRMKDLKALLISLLSHFQKNDS